jgi:hypothetical protein
MPHSVDTSFEVFKYLRSIGYSRAAFVLSENHPREDICDNIASKFSGGQNLITLDNLMAEAKIFTNKSGKTSPPAPIYGLTHPECRCRFIVLPPQTINELIIPGITDVKEKEEILSKMYPQEVHALSTVPKILDVDFSKYINIPVERPVEKKHLSDETWYQRVWNFIKNKIFRKSMSYIDLVRYADSDIFHTGDLIKVIENVITESELGIRLMIPQGYHGLYLSDYPYDRNKSLVYISEYNSIRLLPKSSIIQITNNDIEHGLLYKKILIYNPILDDSIDSIVVRVMDSGRTVWAYDMIKDGIVYLDKGDFIVE